MARQLILLSCLAALVFSAPAPKDCTYLGPVIGGCPLNSVAYGSDCYSCTSSTTQQACVPLGPSLGGQCPAGTVIDPNNDAICMTC